MSPSRTTFSEGFYFFKIILTQNRWCKILSSLPGTGHQKLMVNEELTNLRNGGCPGRAWELPHPDITQRHLECWAVGCCEQSTLCFVFLYDIHLQVWWVPGCHLHKGNKSLFWVSPMFESFENEKKKASFLTGEMWLESMSGRWKYPEQK